MQERRRCQFSLRAMICIQALCCILSWAKAAFEFWKSNDWAELNPRVERDWAKARSQLLRLIGTGKRALTVLLFLILTLFLVLSIR
jgi:hypothetical protein